MDIIRIFQQPQVWKGQKTKTFNSAVYFVVKEGLYLVVATDTFPWIDGRTVNTIMVDGLGQIMHAFFVAWVAKNPEEATELGLQVGAIKIKEALLEQGFSDASNPALWKIAHLSKKCDEPMYSFSRFVRVGILSEQDREILNVYAQQNEPEKILAFLHNKYVEYAGSSYIDFLRSPYMSSVEEKKK